MATNVSTMVSTFISFGEYIIEVSGAYTRLGEIERYNDYYIGVALKVKGSISLPLYILETHEKEGIEEFLLQSFKEIAEMVPHFNHPEVVKSSFVDDGFPRIDALHAIACNAAKVFDRDEAEEQPFFVLNLRYGLMDRCTWFRSAEERNEAAKENGIEVALKDRDDVSLTYSSTDHGYTYDKGFHGARNRRW
nr:MAG TPA: hypothetical protein [Caudoviricetes sp.]